MIASKNIRVPSMSQKFYDAISRLGFRVLALMDRWNWIQKKRAIYGTLLMSQFEFS
jgi:hypothetical protein